MTNAEQEIFDFTALVRRLLRRYKDTQRELCKLKEEMEAQRQKFSEMEKLSTATMRDYETLKTVKMLELGDNDLAATKKRLNKLIRDVDKCITLLTGQQDFSQK